MGVTCTGIRCRLVVERMVSDAMNQPSFFNTGARSLLEAVFGSVSGRIQLTPLRPVRQAIFDTRTVRSATRFTIHSIDRATAIGWSPEDSAPSGWRLAAISHRRSNRARLVPPLGETG
jgi:hypothetical protein